MVLRRRAIINELETNHFQTAKTNSFHDHLFLVLSFVTISITYTLTIFVSQCLTNTQIYQAKVQVIVMSLLCLPKQIHFLTLFSLKSNRRSFN